MKIEDRIQALKLSAKYHKDYEEYAEYREKNKIVDTCCINLNRFFPVYTISREGQKLCRKYKIPYPFNPCFEIAVLPGNQIIPLERGITFPSVLPIQLRKTKEGKQVFGLIDNQYLNVTIDLTRPADDIHQDIKRLCQHYKTMIVGRKRNKDSDIDHWEIYRFVEDQRRTGEENFQTIVDCFYEKRKLSYHIEQKSFYMLVRRAYEKAKRLMDEFERVPKKSFST